jgi:nitroreductase
MTAQNEVLKAILTRRSIRSYMPEPIPVGVLTTIVEAGQSAPYVSPDSRHFTVIRDRTVIGRLNEAAKAEGMKLGDFQREMFGAPGFDGTYGAPVVIILSGNESTVQYEAVCAASVQNILIAATALGLGSCGAYFPIFAFHGAEAGAWREELRIPDGYRPCASILLGYAAEESTNKADERYKNAVTYI